MKKKWKKTHLLRQQVSLQQRLVEKAALIGDRFRTDQRTAVEMATRKV
jgi:hypothetical protein